MPKDKSSYYYPQGLHIGHILFIIRQIGNRDFSEPLRPEDYYKEPKSENFRQTRYKIWFMMELGLIKDDRTEEDPRCYRELTPLGMQWFAHLTELERKPSFPDDFFEFIGRWRMRHDARYYRDFLHNLENDDPQFFKLIRHTLLKVDAIRHFIRFFVHVKQTNIIENRTLYREYFRTPFVRDFFVIKGLRQASMISAEHRIPILVGLLESIGIMSGYFKPKNTLLKLPIFTELFGVDSESEETKRRRRDLVNSYYIQIGSSPDFSMPLSDDVKILRDLFGDDFLTSNYPIIQILPLDTLEEIGILKEVQLPEIEQLKEEEIEEEERERHTLAGLSDEKIAEITSALNADTNRRRTKRRASSSRREDDPKVKAIVKRRDNYTCQICGESTFLTPRETYFVHVHHVIPNGDDSPYNMVAVCPTCHEKFRYGNDEVKIEVYHVLKQKEILRGIETKIGENPLRKLLEDEEISEDVFNALV